jgi:hypothetical protein
VPMLKIYQPPVIFKVLGTLRMLIDGQEELSLKLLKNKELITDLVDWGTKSPDLVGVNSEASRLLAWLVKNGYRSKINNQADIGPLKSFIEVNGTISVLAKMLSSTHALMQNEGLLALTIVTLILKSPNLNKLLKDASLAEAIQDFISKISETERMTNEIIDNLTSLITVLKKSEEMREYLDSKGINENSIPRVKELATL